MLVGMRQMRSFTRNCIRTTLMASNSRAGKMKELLACLQVEKVLQMMEVELGSGSLIHMLCKVYLFIVHQRIAACPVLEPISKAYRAVSKSGTSRNQENAGSENNKQDSYLLKMGGNNLQRQVVKKPPKQLSLIGLCMF
ncbi:protein CHROMOSOME TRANSMISSION FIDELITY 7 [Coffea arabica]|uniref:Protein CHROMOSOME TRANSMISSION FIDELITY 7 n=1 Tax=Coffea arabica TaxID=13443 RepID=A0A6P6VHF7_COFAR|nr:protein CHROMOSOME TRANSMISSION FIDELITY 7-like [Coffea arabica]XP_027101363.1 protein CHROMOSOME TRANSMISSION FIDELITY 7-like [Coffea arabica]XP_027101364.1 protein CHROMOSOME TRANSMISSION FIDELITY 7-like [Coffea arabica]